LTELIAEARKEKDLLAPEVLHLKTNTVKKKAKTESSEAEAAE
jgi:hypothetical protein